MTTTKNVDLVGLPSKILKLDDLVGILKTAAPADSDTEHGISRCYKAR